MISQATDAMVNVAAEVVGERERQVERWGTQLLPDGTGGLALVVLADMARKAEQEAAAEGKTTWRHVLLEEVFEACAEIDPEDLRKELIQVAAVCVAWVEGLDAR